MRGSLTWFPNFISMGILRWAPIRFSMGVAVISGNDNCPASFAAALDKLPVVD